MSETPYTPVERQRRMLEYINQNRSVHLQELALFFHISEATARRDLDELSRQGAVIRTHGGAMRAEKSTAYETLYQERMNQQQPEKERIAIRAAQMVKNGDTVFIDAGTTAFAIAKAISHLERLTIITNDLFTASQLQLKPTSTLMVTGGMRRGASQELVGAAAEEFVGAVHADIAFIGVDGVDWMGNVCIANFDEMGIKRAMLHSAARKVIVADHGKIGHAALVRICYLKDADCLITDDGISTDSLRKLKKVGNDIILA
ncbi:MAG: DeoR/GlpR transcriptional regulator [Clostridia bacterium]|nr:DeoR/GlpR transcriptional regulator [Clostridia bacterium]MBR6752639.1 DeoR/GlpR transcriptional regulator [Clostridia bacterium]